MNYFVVYDPADGKVWRTGSCENGMVPHQAGPEDHEMFLETEILHRNPNIIKVDLETLTVVPKE